MVASGISNLLSPTLKIRIPNKFKVIHPWEKCEEFSINVEDYEYSQKQNALGSVDFKYSK